MHAKLHRYNIEWLCELLGRKYLCKWFRIAIQRSECSVETSWTHAFPPLSSLLDGHVCNVDSQHLLNSSLPPFDEVTTFAAAHIEDFSVSFGWIRSSEGWMTELRNQDRFHPVVEILESDDRRLLALFYAHLWTQIIVIDDHFYVASVSLGWTLWIVVEFPAWDSFAFVYETLGTDTAVIFVKLYFILRHRSEDRACGSQTLSWVVGQSLTHRRR
jgi:hypothetical protein